MKIAMKTSHRFGTLILERRKRQTARHRLKCTPGDILSFQVPVYREGGLAHEIFEAVCTSVHGLKFNYRCILVDDVVLTRDEAEDFARADGFIDFKEMLDWFYAKYQCREFIGFLIKWE